MGGYNPNENNVISGNGAQGILLMPGASGNQILGNQIGAIGPSSNGLYFPDGNGADGVWIQSSGTASDPSGIVYSSSNVIGGAVPGSGNVISLNDGYGVHLSGVGATRNLVEANYIGVAPGGGQVFGTPNPGNSLDGVRIDDAPDNQVGGLVSTDGNVISSNFGAGVYVTGADAIGNTVENNIIGLTAAGSAGTGVAALGNAGPGVADYSPDTMIGPGNVISANLLGVLISGSTATGTTVRDNLIGTDSSGTADLGNTAGRHPDHRFLREYDRKRQPRHASHLGQPGGHRDRRSEFDTEPDRRQLHRHRHLGYGRPRQFESGNPDRGGRRQHGRRHDGRGRQRDLGEPVGHADRWRNRHRQPG